MADSRLIRSRRGPVTYVLRVLVVLYLFLLVAWPVSLVADRAFRATGNHEGGLGPFLERLSDPATVYAFNLTITVAIWAVIANTVFGVGISLLLVRYRFVGRRVLSVLVDLPLSVSPVVVGLALVLAYSSTQGWFGSTLETVGLQVIFSTPGLVLATAFVSLPLVVREVVPVLEEIGTDAEQAARSLGANGRQVFWRITLPSIKWAVVYGVVLTSARSLGEFGAVKIVSSGAEFRGETATLFVHNHYQAFDEPAAYAAALVLVLISIIALVVVTYLRPKEERA
ncbi:sulfate transport system permease protein [Nocardioides zeae]|uniref:Sulfate transport system permease protein n=2 Tax=Nocardioides zeae TaxID=1457234 RepID=A0ACC6IMK1_9ACTN|nr:sulfate ABC transporter permease subunit [Nocardioides zeae]MDQ1106562.1 sulfate transport system permease protein [Nocardioides zeae]MDR6173758.1 sulfate transport system permease protein [Nocardioides zeae]MDR6211954.1 sulfate transport system permease protein [Nocardioides zeae]